MMAALAGKVSLDRLTERFPEILFFEDIAISTFTRMMSVIIHKGYAASDIQRAVNTDEFITVFAGAVYAQVSGMPSFGCDDRTGRFRSGG